MRIGTLVEVAGLEFHAWALLPNQAYRLRRIGVPWMAYLALEVCGYAGPAVAALLGVRPSAVYRAAQRGQAARSQWEGVFPSVRAVRRRRLIFVLVDPVDPHGLAIVNRDERRLTNGMTDDTFLVIRKAYR